MTNAMKRKVFFMHRKQILEKFKLKSLEENTTKFNAMRKAVFHIKFIKLTKILKSLHYNFHDKIKRIALHKRLVKAIFITQAMFRKTQKMKAKQLKIREVKRLKIHYSFLVPFMNLNY